MGYGLYQSRLYVVSDPSVVVTGGVSGGLKTVQKPQQRGRSRKQLESSYDTPLEVAVH